MSWLYIQFPIEFIAAAYFPESAFIENFNVKLHTSETMYYYVIDFMVFT